jgi:hypothetical protein
LRFGPLFEQSQPRINDVDRLWHAVNRTLGADPAARLWIGLWNKGAQIVINWQFYQQKFATNISIVIER